jgi:5-methylcytosine-specific restriction endonuclease McrA
MNNGSTKSNLEVLHKIRVFLSGAVTPPYKEDILSFKVPNNTIIPLIDEKSMENRVEFLKSSLTDYQNTPRSNENEQKPENHKSTKKRKINDNTKDDENITPKNKGKTENMQKNKENCAEIENCKSNKKGRYNNQNRENGKIPLISEQSEIQRNERIRINRSKSAERTEGGQRKSLNHTMIIKVWEKLYSGKFEAVCIMCNENKMYLSNRKTWEVSHIIPHSKEGTETLDNLVPLCFNCNRSMKTASFKEYIMAWHGERYVELMKAFGLSK